MNAKAIVYSVLFIGLVVGGYFLFDHLSNVQQSRLWDLVPDKAVATYERSSCNVCQDSLEKTTWFSLLKNALYKSEGSDTLINTTLLRLSKGASLISVHRTAKHDFQIVFYGNRAEMSLIDEIKIAKRWKSRQRSFDGVIINELSNNDEVISWVDIDGYRALSRSAVLIEDVVRTTHSKNEKSFLKAVDKVASLPVVKKDGGNILLNLSAFIDWLNLFNKEGKDVNIKIAGSSILDIKYEEDAIILNGFSHSDSTDKSSLLQLFKGQSPVPFNLRRQVSNDANLVLSMGFSDPILLGSRFQAAQLASKQNELLLKLGLNQTALNSLYKELGSEVVMQSIEMSATRTSNLFLFDVKNGNNWISTLDRLAEEAKEDTVYAETYSNYLIKRIGSSDLLRLVFPSIEFQGGDLYFTQSGDVLFFSADIETIKKALDDLEQENTWGKSLEKNRFLESTLLESNISIYFELGKNIRANQLDLHEKWLSFFQSNNNLLNTLSLSAIQFSHLNDNFYTNIYLGSSTDVKRNDPPVRVKNSLNLAEKSIHKLFVLKNHNDKNFEIAIQDSTQTLRLISPGGDILWSKKIDGLIEDEMVQVDYYVNGKLQMLFSTGRTLHLIDRLGNYVKPYPVDHSFQSKLLSVIDYDHSKKYRFALSDKTGNVFVMDKQAELLEGWKPLTTKAGELLLSPKHFRIDGRDYIAVLHKRGVFSLYNRRGEMLKGFPVDLKGRPKNDFTLVSKSGSNPAYFVFVTSDGYRIKIDLKGNEIEREALIKPSIETVFSLIVEEADKSYLIVRQDSKKLTLLNQEGIELFSNSYLGLNNVKVKMFDFGTGNVYYTLIDQDQELAYVYEAGGRMLTDQPIQCQDLSLYLYKKKLSVISFYQKSLSINQLK